MTGFRWTTTGRNTVVIAADRVTFEPRHVAFWTGNDSDGWRLLLAVRSDLVNDLHPVEEDRRAR